MAEQLPGDRAPSIADATLTLAAGRYAEALMLLTAVRRLEVVAMRIAQHSGDEAIAAALVRFRDDVPDAKDLRDLLEHLDEYAVGQGARLALVRKATGGLA